jgi:hypothetical protein
MGGNNVALVEIKVAICIRDVHLLLAFGQVNGF